MAIPKRDHGGDVSVPAGGDPMNLPRFGIIMALTSIVVFHIHPLAGIITILPVAGLALYLVWCMATRRQP
jgi:hypothetical protein